MNTNEFIWPEKYRPSTIADCALPANLTKYFQSLVDGGQLQNMLFTGKSGIGKTTVARALCAELGADVLFINASEESGIDTLRTKIRGFASTVSFTEGAKVVILDEADYLNINSTQPALRAFIEEFSSTCRFILTVNHKNRILPALHSRMAVVDFTVPAKEAPKLAAKFMGRVTTILKTEGVTFDEKVVAELVMRYFPDFRRTLNELQRYAQTSGNTIDVGVLAALPSVQMDELIESLSRKDFNAMRGWVANNIDQDQTTLIRTLYDELLPRVTEPAQLVMILHDYSYKAAFVADAELNMVAMMSEIMVGCQLQ